MLFLTPNQQCQSTEGNKSNIQKHTIYVMHLFSQCMFGLPQNSSNWWALVCGHIALVPQAWLIIHNQTVNDEINLIVVKQETYNCFV